MLTATDTFTDQIERVVMSDTVKASFNLPRAELDLLRELAERRSVSVTQALRQALVSEIFLQEMADEGKSLLVEDPNGPTKEVVFSQTRSVKAPAKPERELALAGTRD
jgi:hypothetical protein